MLAQSIQVIVLAVGFLSLSGLVLAPVSAAAAGGDIVSEMFRKDEDQSEKFYIKGVNHFAKGKHAEAEVALLESLRQVRKYKGENDKHVTIVSHQLAANYQNWGKYEKAEQYHIAALDNAKRHLRRGDIQLIRLHANVGSIQNLLGKPASAVNYLVSAQQMMSGTGVNPDVQALVAGNLGSSYIELGKLDKAKPLVDQSCDIWRERYPEDHPHVGSCYWSQAKLAAKQNRVPQAKSYYRKSLDVFSRIADDKHPILQRIHRELDALK